MARELRVWAGGAYDLGYHFAWCLSRRPVLTGALRTRCEELIGAGAAGHVWRVTALVVICGQVHLWVKTHLRDSPWSVARQFQGVTSGVLRREFSGLRSRLQALWSLSYVAAPTGGVLAAAVRSSTVSGYGRSWRQETKR
ncbi:MAG TPA: transposase [Streptosporangiaceae bacterium]|nr:transposase [Streptosporangiaceae bacterium]